MEYFKGAQTSNEHGWPLNAGGVERSVQEEVKNIRMSKMLKRDKTTTYGDDVYTKVVDE